MVSSRLARLVNPLSTSGAHVRGILRPCRHHLGPELHKRWQAHLCGGCLSLRDHGGQASRVLTGYDLLLVSVLVEAQAGRLATRRAGPCPLRGGMPTQVIAPGEPAVEAVAAIAMLGGAAVLADKEADGDLPFGAKPIAARARRRLENKGRKLAASIGFDPWAILDAPSAAAAAERSSSRLEELLAPTGAAVASVFGHTATLAGCERNELALRDAGDAFGRLQHLLDAVSDLDRDRRRGAFNPLDAAGVTVPQARVLAEQLRAGVSAGLGRAEFADSALLTELLGPQLERAIDATFRSAAPRGRETTRSWATPVLGLGAALVSLPAIFRPRPPAADDRRRGGWDEGYERPGSYRSYRQRRCGGGCCGPCCASCACNACLNTCCCGCGDGGGVEVCCC